jgi:hypothetical protein
MQLQCDFGGNTAVTAMSVWLDDTFTDAVAAPVFDYRDYRAAATSAVRLQPANAPLGHTEDWLMPLLDKLKSFLRLPRGWNGYNAPEPEQMAVVQAEDFLFAMRLADLKPNRMAPSVMGGVGVTLRKDNRKAYVEFYNNGRVHVLFSDGESEPTTHAVRNDNRDYDNLILEIRRYLHA